MELCDKLKSNPLKLKDMKTAKEILNEEREHMLPYISKLDTAVPEEPRVDKYSAFLMNTYRYYVPDMYVAKRIFIKIYSNDIICFSEGKEIACHERFEKGNSIFFIDSYISIFHINVSSSLLFT